MPELTWISANDLKCADIPTTNSCGTLEYDEDTQGSNFSHTAEPTELDPVLLYEYYTERGWSLGKIARSSARIFGLSRNVAHTTIRRHMMQYGIPLRDRIETLKSRNWDKVSQ